MKPCLGLATLLMFVGIASAADEPSRFKFELRETAGIRRFGYPVHIVFPAVGPNRGKLTCRLLKGDTAIAAQIKSVPVDEEMDNIHVDFSVSCAPLEKMAFVLEYGTEVKAGPVPRGPDMLTEEKDAFLVRHGDSLEIAVPRELNGLLQHVRAGKNDYLREKSPGLFVRTADGKTHSEIKATGKVVRNGPNATSIRYETPDFLGLGKEVVSSVELDFPRSKSWVEVRWTIDDPEGRIAELGADVNLNITDEPALIDFGAGSFVYVHLKKGQAARMRAGVLGDEKKRPPWETFSGPADKLVPYVVAPEKPETVAEGWAHVMDKQRCTAIAVADFAKAGQEAEITAGADGKLQLLRRWGKGEIKPPKGRKTLTFWLHFVPMPVHVGALTSPQAMLAPLEIHIVK